MKVLKTYKIAIIIIFGLLILIAVLTYSFFDKLKKMFDELSKTEKIDPNSIVSRSEILSSIDQGIASNKTVINHDEILNTIREGLLTHSEINAFEYEFKDTNYFEITQSVHNKLKILGIQILDDKNEIIYPPVRITNDLTVIVDMSGNYSGIIKIF